ncbi:MAG: hypothetical protein QOH20_941, partial [Mycobacterium sp.]|nr:hypothetical protein [Mycobacterium sp.]
VPAHRPHAMRTGPPENTRPPRPRPFGPQPSRTHSCSLTRNGTDREVSVQATGPEERRDNPCPVEATLAVIGGKWKAVLVFYLKRGGAHRFAELRRKTHDQRARTDQAVARTGGRRHRPACSLRGSARARGVFADRIRRVARSGDRGDVSVGQGAHDGADRPTSARGSLAEIGDTHVQGGLEVADVAGVQQHRDPALDACQQCRRRARRVDRLGDLSLLLHGVHP